MIDRYDGEIENINIAGKYSKFFLTVSPTLYKAGQFTQGVSLYSICIVYLHVIESCVKVALAMFYFCDSKNASNIMRNTFDSKTPC